MAKGEFKTMSLAEACVHGEHVSKVLPCRCGNQLEIKRVFKPMYGVTVTDFPALSCPNCGELLFPANIGIAVELLQEKHRLHGAYSMEELLKL